MMHLNRRVFLSGAAASSVLGKLWNTPEPGTMVAES